MINCWVSCVCLRRREADSSMAILSVHARREEMSSADFTDCCGTVTSLLSSPFFFFSLLVFFFSCPATLPPFLLLLLVPPLPCLVPSHHSHAFFYPPSLCPFLCCLISSAPVSGHGSETNGTHATVKRPQVGRGRRLGRVSAYYLFSPE